MRGFRDLPIRRKLVVLGWATSLSALLVSTIVFVTSAYFIGRNNALMGSEILASIIADNLTAAAMFEDKTSAAETIRALRSTPTVNLACVYTKDHALLAQMLASAGHACPVSPPPDQRSAGMRTLTIVRPIMMEQRRVGTLYIESNVVRVTDQLRLQGLAATAGGLAGLLVATLVAAGMHRQISEPIVSLSATSARISRAGDYTLRAARMSNDEIGALVDTFNEMVHGIEQREEELRVANRTKDEFLAALSHEMRTPMNAIVGWLQILRSNPGDPNVVNEAVARLDRNARAQVRLIEDLLDISRIVSGKMELRVAPTDLAVVARTAAEAAKPSASAKELELVVDLPLAPCLVAGDTDRLQQVVGNILSNAIKFTPAKGSIVLRLSPSADGFTLSVVDTGIGISPEFLPRVFDRFRQADGSITRQHGGLGLGMSIARDLVSMHGGRLEATSDGPGKGATFTITLPALLERQVLGKSPSTSAGASLQGLQVLVVDDDEDARRVAGEALKSAGARVVLATSGDEALAEVQRKEFDAFVFDVQMPGLDGYALLRQVREIEWAKGRFTPAVATTGHAYPFEQAQARNAGYQRFVAKPYEFTILTSAVAEAIRS